MLPCSLRYGIIALPTMAVLFAQPHVKWAVAVHGGAGETEWEHMDLQSARQYRAGLTRALTAATDKLKAGAPAIDAVEAAITVLEDDPQFNAGRGSAFNSEGRNEMDASIMDGASLAAGAVAGVQSVKNPIQLARAVMDRTPHVMLIGPGADAFAKHIGLPCMPPSYFFTEARWAEFVNIMKNSRRPVPPRPVPGPQSAIGAEITSKHLLHRYGTVGAVARDVRGNIAAGTSTGGMQGKMPGRVGDSPIIGAATYAANRSCAVSSTGVGEYFIRLAVAKEICALVQYRNLSVQQAADHVIRDEVAALKGGEGGVIVLSTKEDPVWTYNTRGMFRGRQVEGRAPEVCWATCFLGSGRAAAALKYFEQSARAAPGSAEYWLDLGVARQAAGDNAGAVAAFEKSISDSSYDYRAYIALASLYRSEHRHIDANAALDRYLKLGPQSITVRLLRR